MGSTATIAPKFIYATAIFLIDTPNPRRMVDGLDRQIGAMNMAYYIELDGKRLHYVKPVSHGAPAMTFALEGQYTSPLAENVAKRLCGAMRKYGYEPVMIKA